MQTGRKHGVDAIGAACVLLSLLVACAAPEPPAEDPAEHAGVAQLLDEAEALRARGELGPAIEAYERALARTPWNGRISLAMASVYVERAAARHTEGKLARAEADLRSAHELAPDHPQVGANLARLLVERADLDLDPERARLRRAEAETLVPGITTPAAERDAGLERRLDLAFELVERGQLDAGIERLETLQGEHPGDPGVARLLGQALVRRAAELSEQRNHRAAAETLDRAVGLYGGLPGCRAPGWSDCALDDARIAHHNRVVAWLNAARPQQARGALADAASVGLAFPELEGAIAREEAE